MKKLKIYFLLLFVLTAAAGYSQKADSSTVKLLSKLTGTWEAQSTWDNGKEIIAKDANNKRIMRFKLDAKYIVRLGKTVLDSGTFNTNEPQSEIYLQSATDKDHLQEWKVELKGKDNMILRAKKGSKTAGRMYVYARTKDNL